MDGTPPPSDSREYRPETRESSPAAAFALLGDGLRASILQVLYRSEPPVAYATVRDRVDASDPGRINYHLDQLCPQFVAREESGGGYRLQRPGRRAVRLLLEGSVTESPPERSLQVGRCVRCEGVVTLHYGDGFATVACGDCDRWFVRQLLAPGAVADRPTRDLPDLLDARCRAVRRQGNGGVCPECSGRMETTVRTDRDAFDHPATVHYRCRRCGASFDSTLGAALIGRPAVVAFCHEVGIDPTEPLWQLEFAFDPAAVTATDEGARLAVEESSQRLVVDVDRSASIVDCRRCQDERTQRAPDRRQ